MNSFNSPRTKPLYRGTQVVWYILGVLEALLAIRFALKLLGANASAMFTDIIYTISYPFAAPFLGVFRSSRIVEGSVFEWTTLLAMLVYWLLAIAIIKLFLMSRSVSTPEAAVKMEEQE
jgi:hypothetical protein